MGGEAYEITFFAKLLVVVLSLGSYPRIIDSHKNCTMPECIYCLTTALASFSSNRPVRIDSLLQKSNNKFAGVGVTVD